MISRKNDKGSDETAPTLSERILMAVLAPIVFNIFLLIALHSLFGRRSVFISKMLAHQDLSLGWSLLLVLILLPASVGYLLGVEKSAILLGDFFYTNTGNEKSLTRTLLVWGFFALIVAVVAKLLV